MSQEKQSLEEALFELAEQKPSAAERAAFLDGVCRGNPALRARLDALLEIHFGPVAFFERKSKSKRSATSASVPKPSATRTTSTAESSPNQFTSRYQLVEKIGEGGFGEVWLTDQLEPVKRRVAVKILKLGMDSRQIVSRFEAERQALAMMDHPNIAKVFDAGTTESLGALASRRRVGKGMEKYDEHAGETPALPGTGRPYFVMELVRGTKITDYCDQAALPTNERLKLFILVCQAIQHAHQKGIIHRDIKPSNILVTLPDGPSGAAIPKVIDFGIAKATQGELVDKTFFTQFHQFLGTPAYVSPEQAGTAGEDIDTRSDIYSLGVLLYELLVGKTPFEATELMKGGVDGFRQIIREKEPVKPSTRFKSLPATELTTTAQRRQTDSLKLTHLLRGDLDWIVMKCLEKDRARRYETANGLALDIQRYLSNEPVTARPPSAAYRFHKTIRRNRLAVTAAALGLFVLISGVGAVIFVQHRANQNYRHRLYLSDVSRAGKAWQEGHSAEMIGLLDRCPADLRHWEWQFLHQQTLRWGQTFFQGLTNVAAAVLSSDERLAAVAVGDVVQIRDFRTGRWLRDIPFKFEWFCRLAVSPRNQHLAALNRGAENITIWNMVTGERMVTIGVRGWIDALDWSVNGLRLATGGRDGKVRIWDANTGQEQQNFAFPATVMAVAFSPNGKMLAVGGATNTVQLLELHRRHQAYVFCPRQSGGPAKVQSRWYQAGGLRPLRSRRTR